HSNAFAHQGSSRSIGCPHRLSLPSHCYFVKSESTFWILIIAGPSATTKMLGKMKDRKSTRLNSSHVSISYAVFCLKKKISQISDLLTYHRNIQYAFFNFVFRCTLHVQLAAFRCFDKSWSVPTCHGRTVCSASC